MTGRRVAFVCLGNICRSPTADVVLNAILADRGIEGVLVESCGTAGWHVGEPMDPRTAQVLSDAGYDPSRHRARQFGPEWFDHDLILAMDSSNLDDVLAVLPADRHDRVRLFRSYDPNVADGEPVPDVPDPWYGGTQGFLDVLEMVERTAAVLAAEIAAGKDGAHDPRSARQRALGHSASSKLGHSVTSAHDPDADARGTC